MDSPWTDLDASTLAGESIALSRRDDGLYRCTHRRRGRVTRERYFWAADLLAVAGRAPEYDSEAEALAARLAALEPAQGVAYG